MDLLHGDVRRIYFKYLGASFGSALISSIYSMVDTAVVGQYHGPVGAAALAVVAPVWNITYSLGLLTGIGGSVLFSAAKGQGQGGREGGRENEFFSAAVLATAVLACIAWAAVAFFSTELLTLFGAEETLLPLAQQYLYPIQFGIPLFVFNQMLAAFLRNDGSPARATAAVLSGGIFNVFGDYFFVFTLDMGAMGAGLATVLGALITSAVLLTHFFSKSNTLRLLRPRRLWDKVRRLLSTGFSTFFVDAAMGFLTVLFNRQIIRYAGTDALSVYSVIVIVGTVVQCCAYSVGQAAQPIISLNFGAGKGERIRKTLRCALWAVGFFSLVWTALVFAFPNGFIRLFMAPTPSIYRIAPFIMRVYGVSFLLLPLNIFSTYYFQSLMRPLASFLVSIARGLVVSGILICLLPPLLGQGALWFAMPITELLVVAFAAVHMFRVTAALQATGDTEHLGH